LPYPAKKVSIPDGFDLDLLPDRQRDLVRLLEEGLTRAQIAERLGLSAGAVKARLRRLRAALERGQAASPAVNAWDAQAAARVAEGQVPYWLWAAAAANALPGTRRFLRGERARVLAFLACHDRLVVDEFLRQLGVTCPAKQRGLRVLARQEGHEAPPRRTAVGYLAAARPEVVKLLVELRRCLQALIPAPRVREGGVWDTGGEVYVAARPSGVDLPVMGRAEPVAGLRRCQGDALEVEAVLRADSGVAVVPRGAPGDQLLVTRLLRACGDRWFALDPSFLRRGDVIVATHSEGSWVLRERGSRLRIVAIPEPLKLRLALEKLQPSTAVVLMSCGRVYSCIQAGGAWSVVRIPQEHAQPSEAGCADSRLLGVAPCRHSAGGVARE
jgi:hypothetical protein